MTCSCRNKGHCCPLAGRSGVDESHSTLKAQMPTLDALFAKMERGEMPNFLEVLAALSEVTENQTDCDTQPGQFCPTCG